MDEEGEGQAEQIPDRRGSYSRQKEQKVQMVCIGVQVCNIRETARKQCSQREACVRNEVRQETGEQVDPTGPCLSL